MPRKSQPERAEAASRSSAGGVYDHPAYYDLVFGADWRPEFEFLRGCFERHGAGPTRRVFEPACGTGRLLARLMRAGLRGEGVDLNARAVAYCNARLRRWGLPAAARLGDMRNFRCRRPADAAFNMINSFRHLATQADAEAHLRCMAAAVKPGGLYVLGLHLTPTVGRPMEEESYSATRGKLTVRSRMRTVVRDEARREERCELVFDVRTPTRRWRLADEIVFRTHTAGQFAELLTAEGSWRVLAAHDFLYNLDEPVVVDERSEDVVFVLRNEGPG